MKGVGVIDSDFRAEITLAMYNHSDDPYVINPGDRIAQMMILPVFQADIEVVEELSTTERGAGGLGSTGK